MHRYTEVIQESGEELRQLEKQHRYSVVGKRLEMLRKLKTGEARSLPVVAKQINYSLRQCQRWFKGYQTTGIRPLLAASRRGQHAAERMTVTAWQALFEAMAKGEIASYRQARELLAVQGVSYKDDTSILRLFRRHGIKKKSGRPRHEKADPEAQEAFKKTSLRR